MSTTKKQKVNDGGWVVPYDRNSAAERTARAADRECSEKEDLMKSLKTRVKELEETVEELKATIEVLQDGVGPANQMSSEGEETEAIAVSPLVNTTSAMAQHAAFAAGDF